MRIVNPNYVNPLDAKADVYRDVMVNYFTALGPEVESVTPDELRAHFNKTPDQFSDGDIEYICGLIGVEVRGE